MPDDDQTKGNAEPFSANAALNTWNDLTLHSPLVQGLAMGIPAYYLTKWLGQKGEWEYAQRMAADIEDPEERAKYLEDSYNGKASGRLAGLVGAGLGLSPLLFNGGNIVHSLKSDNITEGLAKSVLSYDPVDSWSLFKKNSEELLAKTADYTMHNPYPTEMASQSDLSAGRSFVMPVIRAPLFLHERDIPQRNSLELLGTQEPMLGQANTHTLGMGIANAGQGGSGLISISDMFNGLVGAGLGAAAGWGLAHVMGTIFSQPPALKNKMARYGAIGGAILNSGLLPKAAGYIFK